MAAADARDALIKHRHLIENIKTTVGGTPNVDLKKFVDNISGATRAHLIEFLSQRMPPLSLDQALEVFNAWDQ